MALPPTDAPSLRAQCALTRFGLGAKPGAVKRIAADPRGALEAELAKPKAAWLVGPDLKSTAEIIKVYRENKALKLVNSGRELKGLQKDVLESIRRDGRDADAEARKAKQDRKQRAAEAAEKKRASGAAIASNEMGANDMSGGDMAGGGMAAPEMDDEAKLRQEDRFARAERSPYVPEIAARLTRARDCDIGFAERLVVFWSNHFTVSSARGVFMPWIAGAYEREAIRPFVLGRFSDMLTAVTRHPAMLTYLDNSKSIGPNSPRGQRRSKGINENHARELLELHTVGSDGGYSQADVTALANALTGWRLEQRPLEPDAGEFMFDERAHEPGDKTIMGKRYRDDGVGQAQAVLDDLARKPSTARHIARKLATAFVADRPSDALVDRLSKTFLDTGGDLKQVSLALVRSDEAWDAPRAKMRSPQEFVFASLRAIDRPPSAPLLMRGLGTLGQPFWGATSPKGFSLTGADWIAPDAQTNRLDLAADLAAAHADDIEPNALADDVLTGVMSDETRTAVKRAGSREQAIALLLMSPEMQRR